ncbi:Gfo/Idh/MocA family oxidoreductase [Candidatus Poribacteria bacterium]|nr:Gfo/Idh/MocA family oxidoreductase [Candidatus Poribacteria bacterium]
MPDIGFGIIGCGIICNQHVDAINETPGAFVAAFCDTSEEKARDFAETYKVPYYSSVDTMLTNKNVSVVCICTPSSLHADIAVAAARAGKHVLTEKPMAITNADMDRMIAECKKAGVKLGVVFQRRAIPKFKLVQEIARSGQLGKIVLASVYMKYFRDQDYYDSAPSRGTWKFDGGGCLMIQGIHMIDLLLWFMGSVKSVHGRIATLARKMEAEDTATAILEFDSGALGVIEATTAAYPPEMPHRLEIHGDRGSILIEEERVVRWQVRNDDGSLIDKLQTASPEEKAILEQEEGWNDGHRALVADLVAAITDNRSPFIPGEEGRKAVDLILEIYESSKRIR